MKILIVSNCQTLHIHRVVESLIDSSVIESFTLNELPEKLCRVVSDFDSYDFLIGHPNLFISLSSEGVDVEKIRKLILPPFMFHAFQPDAMYLRVDGTVINTVMGDYHSALIIAGYLKGFSTTEIEKLFSKNVFARLGYMDLWEKQTQNLVKTYKHMNFDVREWLQQKFTNGCFMHSFNHPFPEIIVDLVVFGLRNLGFEIEEPEYSFFPDYLSKTPIWPIYTDIANYMSIKGSMNFKTEGQFSTIELSAFISSCVDLYDEHEVSKRFLEPICYHDGYSRALELTEQL